MKIYIRSGLIIVFLLTMLLPVYGSQRYNDLPVHHWAYHYIEDFSESGLISGYPDGSFRPDKEITYGEFIKLINVIQTGRTLSQPEGCWALNYYNESVRMGLFTLADAGLNDLDAVIPRMTMALIAGNVLKNHGYSFISEEKQVLKRINDVNPDSKYAEHIALCFESGVLNGYPDGSFRPDGSLTRAEAVTVISRISGLIAQSEPEEFEFTGVETVKNRDLRVTNYRVDRGFRGIEDIKIDKNTGIISVYSKEPQEVSLFLDGYLIDPVINSDAEYTFEKGCCVYYFKADHNMNNTKKGIAFGEYIEEVFYYDNM